MKLEDLNFDVLTNDEEIVFVVHKHWFALLGKIILSGLVAFVPILIITMLATLPGEKASFIPGNMFALSAAFIFIWFLYVLPFVFVVWTDHYLDNLILTTHRVIEVEQKGLFSREVSSFRLDRVQDVTTEVSGILPTMFNFGDVHVQTAG